MKRSRQIYATPVRNFAAEAARQKKRNPHVFKAVIAMYAGMLFTGVLVGGCSVGTPEEIPELEEVTISESLPDRFIPHPDFDLNLGELRRLVAEENREIREPILKTPQAFLERVADILLEPHELFLLVDKQHHLPPDYEPDDLVDLDQYRNRLTLNREDLSLRSVLMPDLFAMVEAAAQNGITLDLTSTYRSYRYQEWLFQYWVEQLGRERAEQSSAQPGGSQHQLGTAIDFGSVTGPFAEHPAGRWLADNAWQYGFSLSYPRGYEEFTGYIFEPWHFRYISRAGTTIERYFFGGIQQYFLEFWSAHGDTFRNRYQPVTPREHGTR